MKLTVADVKEDILFSRSDFQSLTQFREIAFLELLSREPLDGSIFRSFPKDTTHIVTRFADRLGSEELTHLRDLEYIGLAYTGWWDKYFYAAAIRARGITVANNPEYAPNAVAEAILACVLEEYRGLRRLQLGDAEQQSPVGRELRGRSFGIIGMGHIGRAVASTATALGMHVLSDSKNLLPNVQAVKRPELIKKSDVLGIFVPKSSGVVVTSTDFSIMKPDAFIVNPSGHENLDTDTLECFLKAHSAATYAYLAKPERQYFQRLSGLPNAKLFPLFASNTEEARQRRKLVTLSNLRAYIEGKSLLYKVI